MIQTIRVAADIARHAGSILMDFRRKGIGFELKGDFDLVTEADRTSEAYIVRELQKAFPADGIVGEEGSRITGTSEYRWYIDPLDGTTNFAHSFPAYCVSIGLARGDEPVAGVIYDPTRDELFHSTPEEGALLNNQPIRVSPCSTLETALIATGFPSRRRHLNVNVHFFYQTSLITHGVRRTGSAAIDLANVACGRAEGFWEFQLNSWDMAAGVAILRAAGGKVTDMRGGAFRLDGPHILATNNHIHAETLTLFDRVFRNEVTWPMVQISPESAD
jgi:myo-inositol-1(or 4)-monophosphatase